MNAQDNKGCNALMRACYQGNVDEVVYLVNKGADKEAKDINGKTCRDYFRNGVPQELESVI